MFNVGPTELMIVLVLALIVFGPKKLPEMGKSIGKGLSEFRKAQADIKREIREGMSETPSSATAPPTSEGAATSTAASDGENASVSSDGQGKSEQPSA
jgi:sec-independent protein translocase protein TatA